MQGTGGRKVGRDIMKNRQCLSHMCILWDRKASSSLRRESTKLPFFCTAHSLQKLRLTKTIQAGNGNINVIFPSIILSAVNMAACHSRAI